MGRLLKIKGDNPFKARAYQRAAVALEELAGDLPELVERHRLTDIRGIGAALEATIEELYHTGRSSMLDRLHEELPPGIGELSLIPGLTVKRMTALRALLGIESLSDLKAACEKNLLTNVKNFGPAAQAKILAAIEKLEQGQGRALLDEAVAESERLLQHLRSAPEVREVGLAGSLRRGKEAVRQIRIVVSSDSPRAVLSHFLRFPALSQCTERSDNTCRARLVRGLVVSIDIVGADDYISVFHRATGSTRHVSRLQELARLQSSAIPSGKKGVQRFSPNRETEIYEDLGMQYVPPEMREDEGEIEAALAGHLPDLVSIEDIRGMVHCHTTYSDGKNDVAEMAAAADALGMKYLTITDHSPSAFYARGVKIDRLKTQWEEIAQVQEKVKVKLLRGTESDILVDGSLDYPDDIIEQFDIVIASIHSRAKMDAEQMTRRLVRAMKVPFFKVWGHPLGRLIQSRPPLECRMEEVLDAVAESRTALEVNGDPRRLDLEPRWIRAARQRGVKFVVSTDAHSTKSLTNLRYGVVTARRGWLTRSEVLNSLDTEAFVNAVHP